MLDDDEVDDIVMLDDDVIDEVRELLIQDDLMDEQLVEVDEVEVKVTVEELEPDDYLYCVILRPVDIIWLDDANILVVITLFIASLLMIL